MSDLAGTREPHPLVLATIPGVTRHSGVMGAKASLHTMVITPDQILFVRATTSDLKRISAFLRQEAKEAGGAPMTKLSAQRASYEVLAQECAAQDPAELLASHDKNFAIDRATVTKVKIKSADSPEVVSEDPMTIQTTGKTYKTVLTGSSATRARQALSAAGLP